MEEIFPGTEGRSSPNFDPKCTDPHKPQRVADTFHAHSKSLARDSRTRHRRVIHSKGYDGSKSRVLHGRHWQSEGRTRLRCRRGLRTPMVRQCLESALIYCRVEKYRPMELDDIVGNVETIERLKVIARDGNMPHIIISVCITPQLKGATKLERVLMVGNAWDRQDDECDGFGACVIGRCFQGGCTGT